MQVNVSLLRPIESIINYNKYVTK